MVKIKKRFSGSTLIETLVAMTLLASAITLSFLSITSIRKSFKNDLRTYAFFVASSILEENDCAILESNIINYQSFRLIVTRDVLQENFSLSIITVTAVTDDGLILCELKEIKKEELVVKRDFINE